MRIKSAKGTNLYTLKGDATRPTMDRAKEALFNIIGQDIVEATFLDLFSGSGAIGLEAASRGAKKVILNDTSKEAKNIIQKNIEKTHLEKNVELYQMDYKKLIETKIKEEFDYIFLDPPYQSNFIIKAIVLILNNNIIKSNGTIILEIDSNTDIEEELKQTKVSIKETRKYGRNKFVFLERID